MVQCRLVFSDNMSAILFHDTIYNPSYSPSPPGLVLAAFLGQRPRPSLQTAAEVHTGAVRKRRTPAKFRNRAEPRPKGGTRWDTQPVRIDHVKRPDTAANVCSSTRQPGSRRDGNSPELQSHPEVALRRANDIELSSWSIERPTVLTLVSCVSDAA